jgi:biotin carboxylase
LARNVLQTMQFSDGVFHVEAKYTSHGPRLIEVNARLGGGTVYPMIKRVWGIDLVEQYLLTRIGVSIQPQKLPVPLTHLAIFEILAPCSGTMLSDDFLLHLHGDARVEWTITYVKAGQHVVGPEDGVPETLAEIAVRGESVLAAQQTLEAILATVQLAVHKE